MRKTIKKTKILTFGILLNLLACFIFASLIARIYASGGSWGSKSPMPTPRAYCGAAVVNNKVYAIGGELTYPQGITNITEMYDPETDTWIPKFGMPFPRWQMGVTSLHNKIYAIGGARDTTYNELWGDCEVYDPVTDLWIVLTPMPTHRAEVTASAVNGKIYVIGGRGGGPYSESDKNEVYDPATNSWTTATPLPNATFGHAAAVLDGKIYIIGGHTTRNKLQVYDPTTDTWEIKADMPTPRYYLAAAATTGSNASALTYAIGGLVEGGSNTGRVEAYDPQTNTWSVMTSMPTYREGLAIGVVNDKLYAVGGVNREPDATWLPTNEEYTPFDWVPEFPSFLIIPLFMLATLLAVIVYKRKHAV